MNPELRRNLWLELSAHRMVAMPVVLGLVLTLVSARSSAPWPLVFDASLWILVALVHLWGTRSASDAVTEEVRARTWDWQRLSSLGPWQMTWGKLFGATAFAWYGAAWCLAAMALARALEPREPGFAWTALALVASGIALHGAALASSLQAARKDGRSAARMAVLLVVVVGFVSAFGVRGPWSVASEAAWYGGTFDRVPFLALSAVAFAAWLVLAAYREMGRELKERALPWAYPAFGIFLGVYLAGFVTTDTSGYVRAGVLLTFLVALALVYFGLFADVTTAMTLRRLAAHVHSGDHRRALESAPYWTVALALAAVLAFAVAVLPPPDALGPIRLRTWPGAYPPLVLLLGAARDAGLLVFFALAPRARRVEITTLFYVLLLWWVVPGMLDVAGLRAFSQAFRPFALPGWAGVLVMAVHVALVWAAVAWRWRRAGEALDAGSRAGLARGV
jgi:hypothetical protein